MASARIAIARARVRAGVLGSVALVAFLAALTVGGLADWTATVPRSALGATLAEVDGQAGAVRWQTQLASDAPAQSDAASAVLDRVLAPRGATWARSVASNPVVVSQIGGEAGSDADAAGLVLLADPDAPMRTEVVDGDATAGPAEGLLQVDAARRLGVSVGDTLLVGDDAAMITISGLWRAIDATEPIWFGDPYAAAGSSGDSVGPLLVDEVVLADLPSAVQVRWTATVPPGPTDVEALAALRGAIPGVEPALRDNRALGGTGVAETGTLPATLDWLLAAAAAAEALAPLPLSLAAIAAITALWRLASLLADARRGETVLLRARGASGARIALGAAAEAFLAAVPAAAIGAGAAELALTLARPGEARAVDAAWAAASLVAVAAVLLPAGVAWRSAARPLVRGAGEEPGRAARGAIGGTVLVVAFAAIAAWRFVSLGSPLVRGIDGRVDVDPLAALAPVLVLVGLSLAALWLARPCGRLLEAAAAQRRALSPALPMRRLVRRPGLYAASALTAMIGVGALTFTAALSGAWHATDARDAAIRTGGDVRVEIAGRTLVSGVDPLALAPPLLDRDGVTADGPALRAEVRVGSDPRELVALDTASLDTVTAGLGDRIDPAALDGTDAAEPAPHGVPVPEGARELSAELAIAAPDAAPGEIGLTAWFLGSQGAATVVDLGTLPVTAGGGTLSAAPPDAADLAFLGFELRLTGAQGVADPRATLVESRIDGLPLIGAPTGEAVLSTRTPRARIVAAEARGDVAVVLDAAYARSILADPGDELDFRIVAGGAELPARVAGLATVLPGGGHILADLGAVEAAAFVSGSGVPQHAERWLAADDPDAVAAALERDRPLPLSASTGADSSAAGVVGPVIEALRWGAGGAAAFALAAFAALAAAIGRSRTSELAVFRAVGVTAREQGSERFGELATAAVAAIAAGIVVGLVTSTLVAPALARAAVPGARQTLLGAGPDELVGWLLAVGVVAVGALAIAGASAVATVRGAGSATRHGEEAA